MVNDEKFENIELKKELARANERVAGLEHREPERVLDDWNKVPSIAIREVMRERTRVKNHVRSEMQGGNIVKAEWAYKHAWAVPNKEAIETIIKLSPVVEIGAGTGYWASLVHDGGGIIDAYDKCPPLTCKNSYHGKVQYYEVKKGGFEVLTRPRYKNWSLFLCWPPGNEMALKSLVNFKGKHVIYAGEWKFGCNATDAFFDSLENRFDAIKQVKIAQHDRKHNANDIFVIFERK